MGWLPASGGYEVTLVDGKVACRATGSARVLKSVPKALKEDEAVLGLRQLKEWLDRHDAACRRDAEDWMVRSLPVPVTALASVWPDESWRAALHDTVIAPLSADGGWQLDAAGFLRDIDPARGLGILNLDGDSAWLTATRVVLPHPVRIPDLDDMREFAMELGVKQGVLQLFREVWRKPEGAAAQEKATEEYSGGHFEELRHLTGRATSLGYAVRGGYVIRRLWEDGRQVDAGVWVGADDPSYETETGDLGFMDAAGNQIDLADVGPVAWSEGMRMAAALYAGRAIEEEDQS
jgi:uncharacterized protein DUF4132